MYSDFVIPVYDRETLVSEAVFMSDKFAHVRGHWDGGCLAEWLDGSELLVTRVTDHGLCHLHGRLGDDLGCMVTVLVYARDLEFMIQAAALTVDFLNVGDVLYLAERGFLPHLDPVEWPFNTHYAVGGRFWVAPHERREGVWARHRHFTVAEASRRFGVPRWRIIDAIAGGKLPAVPDSSGWAISGDDLAEWCEAAI